MAGADAGAAAPDAPLILDASGEQLLAGLDGALSLLRANQEQINDLNVFPVPDGDTGSNMYLTLRAAFEEAERSKDPHSAAAVMSAAAHGSLMGARGNSGVIFSQILRGFSQGLENCATMDAATAARALSTAAAVAYRAVMKPTEGTILTVARDAARAAEEAAAGSDDLGTVLGRAVREGHEAVGRTTSQLAVLREAGVVDAGGFGLAVILQGLAEALCPGDRAFSTASRGPVIAGAPRVRTSEADGDAVPEGGGRRGAAGVVPSEDGFGFCTEFLIHGPGLDLDALRGELGDLGDSALIVGDADVIRVHIHTPDPQRLVAVASERGRLSRLKIEDMSEQHHDVLERAHGTGASRGARRRALGIVSVAPSEGFRTILLSLGADMVVEGGQTMNPSIEDILRAVQATNAESVIVLPNNGNVILTAEQVDALAGETTVVVVPTHNLPQGVSALLALDRDAPVEDKGRRMAAAIERVRAVEITRAVRDSTVGGLSIAAGDVIALIDGEITQVGEDPHDVIEAVLRNLEEEPELITVYHGAAVADQEAAGLVQRLRTAHPGVEFETHRGGQEHYAYVLSLE
ncbi:MAG: DAK2 domain-containing protein [Candidatus Dormibacteria bacterium]